MVTIHHRDEMSLGENRSRLGYEAFHWGILIAPKGSKGPDCTAYDVSDGAIPDPNTRQDLNPERNWFFRPKERVDPIRSGRLIGRVLIGKVPNHISDAQIQTILVAVPLPIKNTTESCVTWTSAAIRSLQNNGIAKQFDIDRFMGRALTLADEWLAKPKSDNLYDYTRTFS